MRVPCALFLAAFVVLAVARPEVVRNTYDDVNGKANFKTEQFDDDGNKEEQEACADVNPGTQFIENENAPDNSVSTMTGTFSQSSSSSTTTTDEDGNETTTGQANELSGNVNGNQVNDNGNVYGTQNMDVTKSDSSMHGVNGVNEYKGEETQLNMQRSKDADGKQLYEDHGTQTIFE